MIEEYLWIEAIQEELKDISKIKLSECSLLYRSLSHVVYKARVACIFLKSMIFMIE